MERPFGHADPSALASWAGATASWPNRTESGGTRGLDDYFTRDFTNNIGAEIMGRNKFGPQRGPWTDHTWQGWWATNHHSIPRLRPHPPSTAQHQSRRHHLPLPRRHTVRRAHDGQGRSSRARRTTRRRRHNRARVPRRRPRRHHAHRRRTPRTPTRRTPLDHPQRTHRPLPPRKVHPGRQTIAQVGPAPAGAANRCLEDPLHSAPGSQHSPGTPFSSEPRGKIESDPVLSRTRGQTRGAPRDVHQAE